MALLWLKALPILKILRGIGDDNLFKTQHSMWDAKSGKIHIFKVFLIQRLLNNPPFWFSWVSQCNVTSQLINIYQIADLMIGKYHWMLGRKCIILYDSYNRNLNLAILEICNSRPVGRTMLLSFSRNSGDHWASLVY